MVKVTGPLLSISASGTIAHSLTYSKQKNTCYVKGNRLEKVGDYHFRNKPYTSQTPKQMAVRENFSNAVTEWKNLTEEEKEIYVDLAKGKATTGIALFIKEYMEEYYNQEKYLKAWLFSISLRVNLFAFVNEWQQLYLIGSLLG